MSARIDMTGQRFGRWVALERSPLKRTHWICRCDCGTVRPVAGHELRCGNSKSCGCYSLERRFRHGHAKKGNRSSTYQAWYSMIQRTTNPKTKQYHDYGQRGITVSEEWRDFTNFLRDMGERPAGMSLERIDNNRGYSADNCKWATRAEQQRNRRVNRNVTINGVTKCLSDWARDYGLYPALVRNRIIECGWPLEKALTTPPKRAA